MDIQFFGANHFLIEINKNKFVIDVPPESYSPKTKLKDASCLMSTGFYDNTELDAGEAFRIATPGEYEIGGAIIKGIQTPSYLDVHDSEKQHGSNVIYTIHANDISLCVLGNPALPLGEDLLENIGTVDVLIVPVGGTITMDHESASKVVKQIDPKICIPSHYEYTGITYPEVQDSVKDFFDEIGKGAVSDDSKLKLKSSAFTEDLEVIALGE